MNSVQKKALVAGAFMLFLFWFWPNFIHEPLHYAAIKVMGGQAHINFNLLGLPAHPSTTHTTPIDSIVGGLFFLLAPSIFSVLLLSLLLVIPHKSILLNVSLPIYLTIDLFINILGYGLPTSDFRFLVLMPEAAWPLAITTAICGIVVILRGVNMEVKNEKARLVMQSM
jgi:hypothetical protein